MISKPKQALREKARDALRNVSLPLFVNYQPKSTTGWAIGLDRNGKTLFMPQHQIEPAILKPEMSSRDLRQMRDDFLQVSTPDLALEFLQNYGAFQQGRESWENFEKWVGILRTYALTGTLKWQNPFDGMPGWQIGRDTKAIGGIIAERRCRSAMEAIATVIEMDLYAGIEWRPCAHCNRLFSKEGKRKGSLNRKEKYCSPKCGHRGCQKERRAAIRQQRVAKVIGSL